MIYILNCCPNKSSSPFEMTLLCYGTLHYTIFSAFAAAASMPHCMHIFNPCMYTKTKRKKKSFCKRWTSIGEGMSFDSSRTYIQKNIDSITINVWSAHKWNMSDALCSLNCTQLLPAELVEKRDIDQQQLLTVIRSIESKNDIRLCTENAIQTNERFDVYVFCYTFSIYAKTRNCSM